MASKTSFSQIQSNIILSVAQIFVFLYSLAFYPLALILSIPRDIYGSRLPVTNQIIAFLVLLSGLSLSIFPIWLIFRRRKGKLPKWMEYLIVLLAFLPVELWIFIAGIQLLS